MAIDKDVLEQIVPAKVVHKRILDIGVVEGLDGIYEFAIELVGSGPASDPHTYVLITPGYTGPCKDESFLNIEVLDGSEAFRKAAAYPDDFDWWSVDESNEPG